MTAMTAIDRFLDAVASGGGIPGELYTTTATLDATVPGWRFHKCGAEAISAEYGRWFADRGAFEELERRPIDRGEVVTFTLTWTEGGVPHAAHHCHVLHLTPDAAQIAADTVFCGGRWDAALLAQMAEVD